MDALILISVVAAMDRGLRGATLSGIRQDAHDRFRFVFEQNDALRTVLFSLRPNAPWMARPHGPALDPKLAPSAFAGICRRKLRGARVEEVSRSGPGRLVIWRFSGGHCLAAELAGHAANLVLLDGKGRIVVAARHPKRSKARLEAGALYSQPAPPRDRLRSGLFGISAVSAELIRREAGASGRSAGTVLAERLAALVEGAETPVIQSSFDPRDLTGVRAGEPESCVLLPWTPTDAPDEGQKRYRGGDAQETAGWYHEAVERLARRREHHGARVAIVSREIRRATQAASRARADAERFEDPDRNRRWAEALLAGVSRARREGDLWIVPDPYDADGGTMTVPADGGLGASETAQRYFLRHRRARRGLEQARARAVSMDRQADLLSEIRSKLESDGPLADSGEIERAMREAGLAVGLEPRSRGRRSSGAASPPPRLEGVRVLTAADGSSILVGKNGRDNHRLTFKLAGPEDFWFHAQGRAGAHVVVRNQTGGPRPPAELLREAAAVAAWYSGGRNDGKVEVQWTRRKYVRRPRGAPAGTVILKRYETVIVRPRLPGTAG